VNGCVGRGPSALLCPGAYYAVKMALTVLVFILHSAGPVNYLTLL